MAGFSYRTIITFLSEYYNETRMSLRTFKRKLKNMGLTKKSCISDNILMQIIVREVNGPGAARGYRAMWHAIRKSYGVSVSRDEVMLKLKEVDPQGTILRKAHRLKRRQYISAGANETWHADGYDKIKPFGFPIHGCIDGFSRRIIWLKVSRSNNNPVVPAYFYLKSVNDLEFCPQYLRTDCGNENGLMASIHCKFTGSANGNAHRYGSSHFNQRIENFWSHCKRGFTTWLIDFFKDLVNQGYLSLGNVVHDECAWFVFSPLLQRELDEVKTLWNTHYIRRSRHDTIPGRPDELFFLPETRGFLNLKNEVHADSIDEVLDENNFIEYAENVIAEQEEELCEYFTYLVNGLQVNFPPNDWNSARELYITIIRLTQV